MITCGPMTVPVADLRLGMDDRRRLGTDAPLALRPLVRQQPHDQFGFGDDRVVDVGDAVRARELRAPRRPA